MKLTTVTRTGGAAVLAALLLAPFQGRAEETPGSDPGRGALAEVGEGRITRADLESYLGYRPPDQSSPLAERVRQRFDEMVLTEVLYREALRLEIDRQPEVARSIRQLVVQRLLQDQVESAVRERTIGEGELKGYYESHAGEFNRPEQARVVEIFLAAPADGNAAVREAKRLEAAEVLAKARALQDARFGFGELVIASSDGSERFLGGDTGFFDREGEPAGIHQNLVDAAFAIEKVGQLTERVTETPEGFHIAMLVGRRAAVSRTFEEVRGEIERRMRQENFRRERDAYIAQLKEKAEVSVDEEALGEMVEKLRVEEEKRAERLELLRGNRGEAVPLPTLGD